MAASKMYQDVTRKIADTLPVLLAKIANARQYMPVDDYCLMYWTEDQMRQVREARLLMNGAGPGGQRRVLAVDVDHPIAGLITTTVTLFIYRQHSDHDLPNPMSNLRGGPNVTKFHEIAAEAVHRALDVGNFIETFSRLTARCETLAQLRYAFPPIIYLLRYAGFNEHANKCEEVTKRPAGMPNFNPMLLKRIRHSIQWFTVQQLLGTFEEAPRLPYDNEAVGIDDRVKIKLLGGDTIRSAPDHNSHREEWRLVDEL